MKECEYAAYRLEKAYVIFVDNVSLWWLKILKDGFRHCYMLLKLEDNKGWVELNPYSNQLIVNFYDTKNSFNYIMELEKDQNLKICPINITYAPLKCAPLNFFSCVEVVKRVLGIHSFFIITPYQLYKKIKVVGKKS